MSLKANKTNNFKVGGRVIKKGSVLYTVSYHDRVEIEEYVVTSIQRRAISNIMTKLNKQHGIENAVKVFMVHKIQGITWTKRSRKHYDYGWDKNIDSCFKDCFELNNGMPYLFAWTKRDALKKAIKRAKKDIKSSLIYMKQEEDENELKEWESDIASTKRKIKTMEDKIKKMKS